MSTEYTDLQVITEDTIRENLIRHGVFSCRIPYTSRDTDQFFSRVMAVMLERTGRQDLHGNMEYIINELSTNASKGVSKRLYFSSKGLDPLREDHYEEGMKNFKEDVFADFSRFEENHRKNRVFVEIDFYLDSRNFGFRIRSSAAFLSQELERIRKRLEMARKFDNLADVFSYGFDSTEGAGFGLIIVILMLRKMNVDEKSLVFENREKESLVSLSIPMNLISGAQGSRIADIIADELEEMPRFPEGIRSLQRELEDPNCTFESIARTVIKDPSLSAEILRIANSPVYMVRSTISDVLAAVRLIGIKGVKSVLFSYGMNRVMKERYNSAVVDEVINHSCRVAAIGSYLARYRNIAKIAEDVYIAGLLHDMGIIIVNSLNPGLEEKLQKLCRDENIAISLLEDLSGGFNHALIGAEVAEKWDFPGNLINPIRYHHMPLEGDEEFRAITYCVYLANEIYYLEKGSMPSGDVNRNVLAFFGFDKNGAFDHFLESLKKEQI